MSQVVDERVVEMRFDNKQFEQNVKTSMSTLDKLKQKLKLKDASKGFEEMETASKKVNMGALGKSVDVVTAKFSALEIMGVTALANITNSAVNSAKAMISAITIDPVRDGLAEYETQMNAVQTILANTQKEGTDVKRVNAALDELNTYADKTIYNFTEMTRNIGTFTAAGVKLDESVSAIKGIANLAAVSGSTSQQASTAMYQLSQAIASGTVKLMDWNSVVNAGMGGQVFQDALTRTSEHLQTGAKAAIEAKGSFRESLSTGWLTTEVLTQTLDQFATAADTQEEYQAAVKKFVEQGYSKEEATQMADMARTANDAATKVKTFTQLKDTLKEAMGSGWTTSWRLIIGDFEEARNMWTNISDFFSNIINNISSFRNDILESALGKGFTEIADKITGVTEPVNKAIAAVEDLGTVVDDVISGKFGNGDERFNALTEAGKNYYAVQNKVNEALGCAFRYTEDQIAAQDQALGTTTSETEATSELTDEKKKLIKEIANLSEEEMRAKGYTEDQINAFKELKNTAEKLGIPLNDFIDNMDQINGRWLLLQSFVNVGKAISAVVESIGKAWTDLHGKLSVDDLGDKLFNAIGAFHSFTASLIPTDETLGKLERTFKGVFAVLDIITTITGGAAKLAFRGLNAVLNAFDLDLLDVTAGIGDAAVALRDFLFSNDVVNQGVEMLASGVKMVVEAFKDWVDTIGNIPQVQEFIENLKNTDWSEIGSNVIEGLKNGLEAGISSIPGILIEIGQSMLSAIKGVLGIHSPSTEMYDIAKNTIAGLVNGLKDGITDAVNALKEIGSKLLSEAQNVDWGKALEAGGILGIIYSVKKITEMIDKFAGPFEGAGKVLSSVSKLISESNENIQKVLKSFSKTLKAKALKTKASALKEFAIAIGIIAAAIYALGTLDKNALIKGGVAVAIIAGVLAALAIAMDKLTSSSVSIDKANKKLNLSGLKRGLVGIGTAVLLIAASVKLLGSMNREKAVQGFAGLAGIVVAMGTVLWAFGTFVNGDSAKHIDKAGKMMKKMATALLLTAVAVKAIGLLSGADMAKGAVFVTAFTAFVALLSGISRLAGDNISKLGGMMIKMSIAMGLMVGVVKLVGLLSPTEMTKGAAFAGAFAIFVFALRKAASVDKDSKIARLSFLLLSISTSMALMVGVVKLAGMLSVSEMLKGAAFAGAFLVFIKALVSITKTNIWQSVAKISGLLLSVSVSMGIMVGVMKLIGYLSAGEIVKGVVVISAFGLIMTTLIAAVKAVGPDASKMANTLTAMAVAISILAGVAVLISFIDTASLVKGLTVVGLLSVMMTAMIWATRGAGDCKKNLIVMIAAIAAMTGAVALLSTLDPKNLTSATLCLAGLMAAFALMTKASSSAGGEIKSMLAMVGVVTALAGVCYVLGNLPIKATISTAGALSTLILSLSVSMRILSKVKSVSKDALVGVLALAGIAAGLTAAIGFLSQNGMTIPLETALSISTLMLALSGACAILGSVGAIAGPAATGAAELMAVVSGVSLILVAVAGLIDLIPGAEEFLDGGITVLEKLGTGLGTFFGSIVGSFASSALSDLPDIGDSLTEFVNKFQSITPSSLDGVKTLTDVILEISAVSIVDGISRLLNVGRSPMEQFASEVTTLVGAMSEVGTILSDGSGLNEEAVNKVITIGEMFAAFKEHLPEDPGAILGLFTTNQNLGNFGKQAEDYCKAISDASSALTLFPVDTDAIEKAASAGQMLSALKKNLPSDPGPLQSLFTENQWLDSFGTQAAGFCHAIGMASLWLKLFPVDTDAVENATNAGKMLSELKSNLPSDPGPLQSLFTENQWLGSFGRQAKNFCKAIGEASAGLDENPVNPLSVARAAIAGSFLAKLKDMIPEDPGVLSKLFSGVKDLKDFGDDAKSYCEAMSKASEALIENSVDSKAVEDAANAGQLLVNLQSAIPEEGWLSDKVDLSEFSERINDFAYAMGNFYDAAAKGDISKAEAAISFAEGLKDFTETVSDVQAAQLTNFPTLVGNIGDAISNYYTSLDKVDASVVSSTVNSAYRLKNFVSSLSDFSSDGIDNFKVEDLGQSLADYATKVASMDFTQVAGSITVATKLAAFIRGLSGIDTSGVSSFKTALTTLGQADASGVAKAFNSASGDMASAGNNIVESLSKGISSKTGEATGAASSVVNKMNAEIVRKASLFLTAGMTLILKLAEGIKSNSGAASEATNSALSTAANGIRGYYGSFHESGSYVAVGLINGINSQYHAVYEAGYRLGQAAIEGERAGQQSHSPSKLAEQSGVWIGEGLIIGINSMGQKVNRAGESLGENVTGSLSSVISKASDLFELSMGAEPTVTPVVDLTNVRAASDSMNSMFSDLSVGANANLRAVNVMMSNRGQNGNSDVVTAINKLGKKLGNMGNTYNIGGVTYDESSDVGMAIQTLTRAVLVEGRR